MRSTGRARTPFAPPEAPPKRIPRPWPAWILAALTTFELRLRVGPLFVPPTTGRFDPGRVLAAARRGRAPRFDPLDPAWDYPSLLPLALPDARAQLGI